VACRGDYGMRSITSSRSSFAARFQLFTACGLVPNPLGLYYFLQFFRWLICCAVYYFLLSAAWKSLRALLLLSGLPVAANSLSLFIT
jgi:hypothetical protein